MAAAPKSGENFRAGGPSRDESDLSGQSRVIMVVATKSEVSVAHQSWRLTVT